VPSPRKAPDPAWNSDRQELENLLRSAAKAFQTSQPHLIQQLPQKQSSTVPHAPEQRCGE